MVPPVIKMRPSGSIVSACACRGVAEVAVD
jgi:hypothetical protein